MYEGEVLKNIVDPVYTDDGQNNLVLLLIGINTYNNM